MPIEWRSQSSVNWHQVFEITGMFLEKSVEWKAAAKFWISFWLYGILFARKSQFVLTYLSEKKKLGAFYKAVKHDVVYDGKSAIDPTVSIQILHYKLTAFIVFPIYILRRVYSRKRLKKTQPAI